jgi:outer membrane receptor for ferrienterochelin and colicins
VDQSSVMVGQLQQGFTLGSTKFTAGLDVIMTTPVTEGTINGRNENDDNISEIGGYIQVTQPLSDKFDFLGAARIDQNSRITGQQFSPRAAILYKMSPTQNFRFTFNRAFNSPASFAFALDQFSGQTANLGPAISPPGGTTEVRIFGNPSKRGWQYDRSCAGTQTDAAGLCMRSNFTGGGPTPVAGATMFPATMNALAGQLAGGLGLPPTQAANVAAALRALTPTNAQIPMILRNVLAGNAVAPFSGVQDYDPLGANFSNTWEVGYKGIIGDRLRISADYWFQIRPAEPTTQVINGDDIVFFNPTTLGAYLGAPATGITAALAGNGVPGAAIPTVLTNWVTTLAGLPTGALNFDNPIYDKTYLVFTYQNAKGQVDVRGIDLAADYIMSDMYTFEATYSQLSRNVWADASGATAANPLTANTPLKRASVTIRRTDEARGMTLEARGRYADAFDVNSGVFNSYNVGTPVRYDRVPVNTFLDLGFSWKLPVAQNVRWSLNIQNVLGNEVQSFVGVAPVGRFGTTRVSYTF